MAIRIAFGGIYAHFPDHPKRSRIISPDAVSSVANVCWRVLRRYETTVQPESAPPAPRQFSNLVPSNRGPPAVDGEFCAVNETRTIGRQEDNGLGNFVRGSRAPRWRLGG